MAKALLIVLFLCSGCMVGLPDNAAPPTQDEYGTIDWVIDSWQSKGLNTIGHRCEKEYDKMRIVHADGGQLVDLCGGCQPGQCISGKCSSCVAGCYQRAYSVTLWPWGFVAPSRPFITIATAYAAPLATVAHETLHWLGDCTGRGADPRHTDAVRWNIADEYWDVLDPEK